MGGPPQQGFPWKLPISLSNCRGKQMTEPIFLGSSFYIGVTFAAITHEKGQKFLLVFVFSLDACLPALNLCPFLETPPLPPDWAKLLWCCIPSSLHSRL